MKVGMNYIANATYMCHQPENKVWSLRREWIPSCLIHTKYISSDSFHNPQEINTKERHEDYIKKLPEDNIKDRHEHNIKERHEDNIKKTS